MCWSTVSGTPWAGPWSVEAGYLDMNRKALQAHCEATGADPFDIAAALLALTAGDEGTPADEGRDELSMRHDRDTFSDRKGDRGRWDDRGRGDGRGRERGGRTRSGGDGNRYRISVGHRDGVTPQAIVGAMTGEGGLRGAEIGKIDIFPSFSLVEVPLGIDGEAQRRIGAAKIGGRALRIKADSGPPNRGGRREGREGRRPRSYAS